MNRDAKRISTSFRSEIERTKSAIRNSNGRGFDGMGYVFKQAVKELREKGMNIVYDKEKCSYFVIEK